MEKKEKIFTLIGVIAAAIACFYIYKHYAFVSTDNAHVEAHTLLLAPQVGGYVKAVNVVEGQKVKKDDIILEIDSSLEVGKLKAPSDGFIARSHASVGTLATIGVPLFGFVDAHERWIIANFKETEIASIQIGSKANIHIDAIPSKRFSGTVVAISSATGATFSLLPPDNATGNFTKVVQRIPVRIQFEAIPASEIEDLRAGLSATVDIHRK